MQTAKSAKSAKSTNQVKYPQQWEFPTAVEPVEVSMDQRHTRSPDKLPSLHWKKVNLSGTYIIPVYCDIHIYIYIYTRYDMYIYIYVYVNIHTYPVSMLSMQHALPIPL